MGDLQDDGARLPECCAVVNEGRYLVAWVESLVGEHAGLERVHFDHLGGVGQAELGEGQLDFQAVGGPFGVVELHLLPPPFSTKCAAWKIRRIF